MGAIYIYERESTLGGAWLLADKITIDGLLPGALGNCDLHLDGTLLVVGISDDDSVGVGAGATYVFERKSASLDSWEMIAKLVPHGSQGGASFGRSVVCFRDTIVVGAPNARKNGVEMGAAYVFRRSSSDPDAWIEIQELVPDALHLGSDFGHDIAMDDQHLVIGAPNHNATVLTGGAVFVFSRALDQWGLNSILSPKELSVADGFGSSVALQGNALAVGSPGEDLAGPEVGALYVYDLKPSGWVLTTQLLPVGLSQFAEWGGSIAIDADNLFSGAPLDSTGGFGTGAVVQHRWDSLSQSWSQVAVLRASDGEPNSHFGIVDAADGTLAVGAGKALKPGSVYLFGSRGHRTVATYCTGTAGTLRDCVPALESVGVPTASFTSEFRVWSRNLPGAHFGLFLYTTAPWALPDLAASGICLPGGSVRRSGILWSGGTAGVCDGVLDVDWNSFGGALAQDDPALAVPGTTVHGQFVWFEPFGSSALTWSNAVAFQLCP